MLLRATAYFFIAAAIFSWPTIAVAQPDSDGGQQPNSVNLEELLPQSQDPPPPVYTITDVGPAPQQAKPTPTRPAPAKPITPSQIQEEEEKPEEIIEPAPKDLAQQQEEKRQELDNWLQEGCWIAVRNDGSVFSHRTYCFDGHGSGTVTNLANGYCSGTFRYVISNNGMTVTMRNSKQSCGIISVLIEATVSCQRDGDLLRCHGRGTHWSTGDTAWNSHLKRR